jgi:hypothetical protein
MVLKVKLGFKVSIYSFVVELGIETFFNANASQGVKVVCLFFH